MTVAELMEILDDEAPAKDALEWDNVGLLVGDADWEAKKVYVALDATDEVIEKAIEAGADMLVTHHPLIYKKIGRVVQGDFIGRRIIRLINNHIAYYAMHTNFDIHRMGKLAEEKLGLGHTISLDPCPINGELDVNVGIGRIGSLLENPVALKEYAELVRKSFDLPYVRVYGDGDQVVHTIAVSPGSGKSEIQAAIVAGADVLVTGDIDHHSGIDAVARNLCIIDAGHYGVEHIFIEYTVNLLREKAGDIEAIGEPKEMPYWICQ